MSEQVKIPADTKREIALWSAASGQSQGALLARAWQEFRERHASDPDMRECLRWARSVLDQPAEAAVVASGMAAEDLSALQRAVGT